MSTIKKETIWKNYEHSIFKKIYKIKVYIYKNKLIYFKYIIKINIF